MTSPAFLKALVVTCFGSSINPTMPTVGAKVDFGVTGLQAEVLLFNESQSRVVVTVSANNAAATEALARWRGTPVRRIGTVGGSELKIEADGSAWNWEVTRLQGAWGTSIANCMSAAQ